MTNAAITATISSLSKVSPNTFPGYRGDACTDAA